MKFYILNLRHLKIFILRINKKEFNNLSYNLNKYIKN
jgi:hypothetical protein